MTAPTHEEIAKITRELIDKGLVIEAGLDWYPSGGTVVAADMEPSDEDWRIVEVPPAIP